MADDGNGSSSSGQAQAQRYLRGIDNHAGKAPWLGAVGRAGAESGHCGKMRLDEVIQPLETAVPFGYAVALKGLIRADRKCSQRS